MNINILNIMNILYSKNPKFENYFIFGIDFFVTFQEMGGE